MQKDKFDIFLEGEVVNLVILNEKIAKNSDWYSWLNYKKIQSYYNKVGSQIQKKTVRVFQNNIVKKRFKKNRVLNDKKIQLGIVEKHNNKLVGMVTLLDFDYFNRCCGIS